MKRQRIYQGLEPDYLSLYNNILNKIKDKDETVDIENKVKSTYSYEDPRNTKPLIVHRPVRLLQLRRIVVCSRTAERLIVKIPDNFFYIDYTNPTAAKVYGYVDVPTTINTGGRNKNGYHLYGSNTLTVYSTSLAANTFNACYYTLLDLPRTRDTNGNFTPSKLDDQPILPFEVRPSRIFPQVNPGGVTSSGGTTTKNTDPNVDRSQYQSDYQPDTANCKVNLSTPLVNLRTLALESFVVTHTQSTIPANRTSTGLVVASHIEISRLITGFGINIVVNDSESPFNKPVHTNSGNYSFVVDSQFVDWDGISSSYTAPANGAQVIGLGGGEAIKEVSNLTVQIRFDGFLTDACCTGTDAQVLFNGLPVTTVTNQHQRINLIEHMNDIIERHKTAISARSTGERTNNPGTYPLPLLPPSEENSLGSEYVAVFSAYLLA